MKKPTIPQPRLIVLVITCMAALLVAAYTDGFATKMLLTGLFLTAGGFQVWLSHKVAPGKSLTHTISFFGITAVLLSFIFSVLHAVFFYFDLRLAFLAFCGYLLPQVFALLWPMFRSVNNVPVKDWSYTDEVPHWKSTIFLNSIPVRFQVLLTQQSTAKKISFRAPVRMQLGLIFFHMIQEKNEGQRQLISLTGEDAVPLRWIFYVRGPFGWRRYLDPERSLSENNIKSNMLIIVQQLTAQDLLPANNSSFNHPNQSE